METQLTKAEESHVDRMAESFSEPSPDEHFKAWSERVVSHGKQEKKEKQNGPREIKLAGRSSEEREWIEKVAQKDESKDSGKESRRESAAEKDDANRTEQRPDAKAAEKSEAKAGEKSAATESNDSPSEPLSGDLAERHWQGKLQGPEIEKHISQVNSRVGIIMEHINQHPQKAQIEDGFRALMAGRNSGVDKPGFFRDLATALAEVPDPGRVFQHITMQPQDREFLRNVKTAKELRAAIQTIAKAYPGSASKAAEVRPRAPKPPSEVGGRGAETDDGTRGESNFSNFSARMSQRYAQR
jgi:hypothetical protein